MKIPAKLHSNNRSLSAYVFAFIVLMSILSPGKPLYPKCLSSFPVRKKSTFYPHSMVLFFCHSANSYTSGLSVSCHHSLCAVNTSSRTVLLTCIVCTFSPKKSIETPPTPWPEAKREITMLCAVPTLDDSCYCCLPFADSLSGHTHTDWRPRIRVSLGLIHRYPFLSLNYRA